MSSETPARDDSAPGADQPTDTRVRQTTLTIDDPNLGRATAILDDRSRTKRDLWLALACIAAGFLGVYFGVTDAQAGDGTAWFWMLSGLILVAYGVAMLRSAALRLVKPVRLVLGDEAFDYPGRPGNTAIRWDELSAAELEIPAKQTRPVGICFQVRVPEAFAERHELSGRAARRLVATDGWITVRGETAMPLEDVVGLMGDRIEAARASLRAGSPVAAKRHRRRTSRH